MIFNCPYRASLRFSSTLLNRIKSLVIITQLYIALTSADHMVGFFSLDSSNSWSKETPRNSVLHSMTFIVMFNEQFMNPKGMEPVGTFACIHGV